MSVDVTPGYYHANWLPAKDLSHVPCKFYRVGSCTAGLSCPFSHSSPSRSSASNDPNPQPKDVCAWFVKGTCKFGHKCALAHVLPGQSMAMDRKNKKAAQIAANAQGGGGQSGGKGGKGNKARGDQAHGNSGTGSIAITANSNTTVNSTAPRGNNPLLSGSTAPTRSVHTIPHPSSPAPATGLTSTNPQPSSTNSSPTATRMPMPTLKATISPSAPAPPLKDTDFASFAMMGMGSEDIGVIGELASAPALPHARSDGRKEGEDANKAPPPTSPLPLSNPSRRVTSTHHHNRPSHDFGPIGSPPRSSPRTHSNLNLNNITHLNGFSPATSPPTATQQNITQSEFVFSGTSPFSAPAATTTSTQFFSSSSHDPSSSSSPPHTSSLGMDLKHHQQQQYRSGLAASLGTAHLSAMMAGGGRTTSAGGTPGSIGTGTGWSTDFGPVPSQVLSASASHAHSRESERERDIALEDEDLEEFIPGSLSDLLTPNERSRRMSRTSSGHHQGGAGSARAGLGSGALGTGMGLGVHEGLGSRHHYSRSVPAPSLLGDLKSIWASNDAPLGTTTTNNNAHNSHANLGIGTPSSFKSSNMTFTGLGGDHTGMSLSQSYGDRESSMLSPTNASAAFLGGLHHHYLSRGVGGGLSVQRSLSGERTGAGERTASGGGYLSSGLNGNGLGLTGVGGTAFSPSRLNTFGSRPPFSIHDTHSSTSSSSQIHSSHTNMPSHSHLAQDLGSNGSSNNASTTVQGYTNNPRQPTDPHANINTQTSAATAAAAAALSPSTRALQSHAPGQSLPQGLAAGYSRIHALPPPPNMGPSPSFSGVGSPGSASGSPGTTMGNLEWLSLGPKVTTTTNTDSNAGGNGGTGLESMFSRLSYSAATSRPSQPSALSMTSSTGMSGTPAIPRSTSGGKPWQAGSATSGGGGGGNGPLSPLSGPVLTGDDDDLFSMDG
jgi:hypothetical protein